MELGHREDLGVGPERDLGAGLLRSAHRLDRRDRAALLVGLLPDLALAQDLDLEPLGERVDDRDADAVQAARDLVGVVVELSARVQVRHDDLERLALVLLVHPDRDAAAVVLDRHGVVGVDRDAAEVGVADLGLVDRVVDELEDHVVQAREVVRVPDVHAGALAHGLEALQQLDRIGGVGGAHRTPCPAPTARRARGTATATAPPRTSSTAAARRDQRAVGAAVVRSTAALGGKRLEKLLDRGLREARVEIIGAKERRLARGLRDGLPLRELRQSDRAGDLARGGLGRQSAAAALPDEIVALRSGERVAAAPLEGRHAFDGRAHLVGRAVAARVGRLDVGEVSAGAARELSEIGSPRTRAPRRDGAARPSPRSRVPPSTPRARPRWTPRPTSTARAAHCAPAGPRHSERGRRPRRA